MPETGSDAEQSLGRRLFNLHLDSDQDDCFSCSDVQSLDWEPQFDWQPPINELDTVFPLPWGIYQTLARPLFRWKVLWLGRLNFLYPLMSQQNMTISLKFLFFKIF